MAKATLASIERDLKTSLGRFREQATEIKHAHQRTYKSIVEDEMISELAKRQKIEAPSKDTRAKLDALRAKQDQHIKSVRFDVEKDLIGYQSPNANDILLRRDAARGGDDSLADAIGYRARQAGWLNALDAYQEARPQAADSAAALAFVEGLDSNTEYNLSNQISYSTPSNGVIAPASAD